MSTQPAAPAPACGLHAYVVTDSAASAQTYPQAIHPNGLNHTQQFGGPYTNDIHNARSLQLGKLVQCTLQRSTPSICIAWSRTKLLAAAQL